MEYKLTTSFKPRDGMIGKVEYRERFDAVDNDTALAIARERYHQFYTRNRDEGILNGSPKSSLIRLKRGVEEVIFRIETDFIKSLKFEEN